MASVSPCTTRFSRSDSETPSFWSSPTDVVSTLSSASMCGRVACLSCDCVDTVLVLFICGRFLCSCLLSAQKPKPCFCKSVNHTFFCCSSIPQGTCSQAFAQFALVFKDLRLVLLVFCSFECVVLVLWLVKSSTSHRLRVKTCIKIWQIIHTSEECMVNYHHHCSVYNLYVFFFMYCFDEQ